MLITINQLKEDIIERYGEDDLFYCFGLGETTYEYKTDSLTVKIIHYKNDKINYKIVFNDVVSYRVMQESYFVNFKNEDYTGFSFFYSANNSRFKKEIVEAYSYGFVHGEVNLNKLKSYRISGLDNFIEILTTEIPIIEVIEN